MWEKFRDTFDRCWPYWMFGGVFLIAIGSLVWLGFETGWTTPIDSCYE